MKNIYIIIVLLLTFQLKAQTTDFSSFIANFSDAKLPFNCCTKTNKPISSAHVQQCILSSKKAQTLKLSSSLLFEYGFQTVINGFYIVTIYVKNPEDGQANFHYILIYNKSGELTDGRLAGGRLMNSINGNMEISDITFVLQQGNSVDINTRISVQDEDSRELRTREEIQENLKVNAKGELVE